MTNPNNAGYRTREIGSWFRWHPDEWKPITPLAGVCALATAIAVFAAAMFIGGRLLGAYADYGERTSFLSGLMAVAAAGMAFYTALNCRPADWQTGLLACAAAVLVVSVAICTTISAATLIVVLGSTGNVNAALPYAVLISGIPGIPTMLGAVILLGRRPAAPTASNAGSPP